jgi:hypothetical protein
LIDSPGDFVGYHLALHHGREKPVHECAPIVGDGVEETPDLTDIGKISPSSLPARPFDPFAGMGGLALQIISRGFLHFCTLFGALGFQHHQGNQSWPVSNLAPAVIDGCGPSFTQNSASSLV